MANLRANFMFNRDFQDAFLHVIKSLLSANVQDVKVQNAVKFFISPPVVLSEDLRKYGCWCDEALNSPHHYKDCDNIKGKPYPSIVGEDPDDDGKRKVSHLPLCPDLDENVPEHRKDHNHRLGCFKPVEAAEKFMDWFMEQEVGGYSGSWYEKMAVRDFVDDYMRRVSIFEPGEFDRIDKEDMVLSLLLGFQGSDIEDGARKSPVAWEAERLLKFLGWNELGFKTSMRELGSAMEEVIKMRLPTNRSRGGRSRRDWEKPRRSPTREQYGREESPWERPRKEYSPWRCISPEEQYLKGESTRRPNPPEAQYYRNESQWQDPPRERQGRNPSRKRYEREDRKLSPSRARSRGEDGRGRYNLPEEQPRVRYEYRSPNLPRGKSQGRVVDPPRRYEPRAPSPRRKRHGRR